MLVKRRKKYKYMYMFVSFGLECPKAQKRTYSTAPTVYSGDWDGLEGDYYYFCFTKHVYRSTS